MELILKYNLVPGSGPAEVEQIRTKDYSFNDSYFTRIIGLLPEDDLAMVRLYTKPVVLPDFRYGPVTHKVVLTKKEVDGKEIVDRALGDPITIPLTDYSVVEKYILFNEITDKTVESFTRIFDCFGIKLSQELHTSLSKSIAGAASR